MNSATDAVMLIIDNDREALRLAFDLASVDYDVPRVVAQALRDQFEPMVEDAMNNLKRDFAGSLTVELINCALAQVSWGALAAHYERKVKEGVTV